MIRMLITRRKLLFKLILSFFILAVLSVVIIYTAFTKLYIASVSNELKQEYLRSLDRTRYDFDNMIGQISQTYQFLNQNSDVCFYFYSDQKYNDAITINRASMYLRAVKLSNPFLDSIYLYNAYQDYPLIAGNYDFIPSHFLSTDVEKPITESKYNIVFSTNVPVGGKMLRPATKTISFVFSGEAVGTGINDKALIFTLNRDAFESYLKAKMFGSIIVVDQAGNIIFGSGTEKGLQSISGEAYFKTISDQGGGAGSLMPTIDGKEMIVSYVTSTETGFYIIGLNPTTAFSSAVSAKRMVVIGISFGTLLVYSIIGLFLARSIYKPIDKSFSKIMMTARYDRDASRTTDELATIQDVFRETQTHIETLEKKLRGEQNRDFEAWVYNLLTAGEGALEAETANAEHLELLVDSQFACVLIDNYQAVEEGSKGALEHTIRHTFENLMEKEFLCRAINLYQGEIALLIRCGEEGITDEERMTQLGNSLCMAKESLRQMLSVSLTIGVGPICQNAKECRGSYAEALRTAKNRFVLGPGRVINSTLVEGALRKSIYYPTEIEDQLQQAVRQNNRELFTQTLAAMVEMLKHYAYPDSYFLFSQLSIACIKSINQVMTENAGIQSFYQMINDRLAKIETIGQGELLMLEIFSEYQKTLEELHKVKGNKQYSIVESAKQLIAGQYADVTLSVDSVSERFGYSPYYFSRLFKELVGLNATDFIRKVRLEKAKELLCQTHIRISEIPECVGFTNASHFSKVFKGAVGMTPTAYREYMLRKNKPS